MLDGGISGACASEHAVSGVRGATAATTIRFPLSMTRQGLRFAVMTRSVDVPTRWRS